MHTKHHVIFLYTIGKNQLGILHLLSIKTSSSTGTCSQTKQLQGKPKRFQRRHGNVGVYETWNQWWWCKGNRSGPPKCSKKFQVGCVLFVYLHVFKQILICLRDDNHFTSWFFSGGVFFLGIIFWGGGINCLFWVLLLLLLLLLLLPLAFAAFAFAFAAFAFAFASAFAFAFAAFAFAFASAFAFAFAASAFAFAFAFAASAFAFAFAASASASVVAVAVVVIAAAGVVEGNKKHRRHNKCRDT